MFALSQVDDCFVFYLMVIKSTEVDPNSDEFLDYSLDHYISSNSKFLLQIWSDIVSSTSRTITNNYELFHSKLNNMFYKAYPNIYNLIDILNEENYIGNTMLQYNK